MWKKIKQHGALAAFATLALIGVFTHTQLSHEPPNKGFCTFCGTIQPAIGVPTAAKVR
jgi:hypothetical protein